MTQTANHILSLEGILTTFQIAKKVSSKDIKKLRDKMKIAKMDKDKLQEIVKQSVLNEAEKCIKLHKIPGLIIENTPANPTTEEEKRIVELTYFSSLIAKKMTEKQLSKYHSCYIVNAIVNMLGLNDHDFEDFHRRFTKFKNGKDPNSDDDTPTFS